jgi:hypothetical protein
MIFHSDPDLEAVDWNSLRKELAARDLLQRAGLVIAGTNWRDCGKLDYALRGRMQVICLTDDPREYGISSPPEAAEGLSVLIFMPLSKNRELPRAIAGHFESVTPLFPIAILQAGMPVLQLGLFLGSDFRAHPDGIPASSS